MTSARFPLLVRGESWSKFRAKRLTSESKRALPRLRERWRTFAAARAARSFRSGKRCAQVVPPACMHMSQQSDAGGARVRRKSGADEGYRLRAASCPHLNQGDAADHSAACARRARRGMLLAAFAPMLRAIVIAGVFCLVLLRTAAADDAPVWQSLEDIRLAAIAHVRAELAPGRARHTVDAAPLDERLHLRACAAPLETFTPPGGRRGANGSVGVRCAGPQPWKLYVSVRISSRDRVLVATHALARDAVLGAGDYSYVERDLEQIPQGYVTDATQLEGMRLRRPVAGGAVITPSMLAAVPLIARGQQVTLEAGGDSLHIRMAGEALGEAALGQRVRVRNLSSERVVEGVVRSAQVVEVLLR
jgi:flagellar basal body P-ring formation protein FlgA